MQQLPPRQALLLEARSWIGTAFHHQGRIKANVYHKGGCDCVGLVLGVADALQLKSTKGNLIKDIDIRNYCRKSSGILLKKALREHCVKISQNELLPGDLLLFKISDQQYHIGIVSDYNTQTFGLIHSYAQAKKVVEHSLTTFWQEKIAAAYKFASF
jgi:NlpC/P60 family putative phage cell wall peptidase